jgi:polyisoprenoid-binding protein YceI
MSARAILTLTLAAALTGLTMPTVHAAEAYTIDPSHSSIGFAVKHFGISNVRGQFNEYSGEVMIDAEELTRSSVRIEIAAESIDTSHEERDGHLRSADFFDAENHPALIFESTKIENTGEGEFLITGNLTIRGMTHEIQIPVAFGGPITARGSLRIGIEGEVTIDRQDYGVSFSRVMDTGGLVVGNDVKISFALEASRPIAEAGTGS